MSARDRTIPGPSALAVLAALAAAAASAAPAGAPGEPDVGGIVRMRLASGEDYRLVRLSDAAHYAQFASSEVRSAVFEGITVEALGGGVTGLTLTVPAELLAEAYARAPDLGGIGGEFRDALVAGGFFPLRPAGPHRVLITLVETSDLGRLYDFSLSESFEAVTERAESLRRLEGSTAAETRSLSRFEENHPTQATFELWRFDDLPDLLEEAEEAERREERVAAARRARFLTETVRALYWVDPAYEDAVLDWIESDLDQAEVDLLVQLLQIAGVEQISARVLVREAPPHLYDTGVLTSRLFGRLEALTRPVGKKGHRKLDREQFASDEIFDRASAFYARFFVDDGAGRYEFRLEDDVAEFVARRSEEIRRITAPFLARLLAEMPAEPPGPTADPAP